jgi:hypothetical protein
LSRTNSCRPSLRALAAATVSACWDGWAAGVRLGLLGLTILAGWHRALIYANLRLGWFEEFQRYWVDELGNRPLHPHDFYHLYGVYRQ